MLVPVGAFTADALSGLFSVFRADSLSLEEATQLHKVMWPRSSSSDIDVVHTQRPLSPETQTQIFKVKKKKIE